LALSIDEAFVVGAKEETTVQWNTPSHFPWVNFTHVWNQETLTILEWMKFLSSKCQDAYEFWNFQHSLILKYFQWRNANKPDTLETIWIVLMEGWIRWREILMWLEEWHEWVELAWDGHQKLHTLSFLLSSHS
jgi:hypothetical protein